MLDQYAKYSGLKPNIEKTRCVWLGNKKHSEDKLCIEYPLIWSDEPFTFLGIIFSVDVDKMEKLNFEKKLHDITTMIKSWSKRILSPIGKITVVKSLMISKLTHLFISLPTPSEKYISDLERKLYKFIWNDKPDKIGRNTLSQNYSDGGLKMINLRCFIKSMKLSWVKRLINDDSLLSQIFETCIGDRKCNMFRFGPEYLKNIANRTSSHFWKDVINTYYEFRNILLEQNENSHHIYEPLWYNKKIQVNKKPICYIEWSEKGILYINDFFDHNGDLLNYDNFCVKYNFNPPITLFYGIVTCLTKNWPSYRSRQVIILPHFKQDLKIIIRNKTHRQSIYETFLSKIKKTSKHMEKWSNELNFNLAETNITAINLLPVLSTTDCKLRWFQYKIIHRSTATNIVLEKMKISETDLCTFCKKEKETIIHLFCQCDFVKTFWENVLSWINSEQDIIDTFLPFEIIFGLTKEKKNHTLNILIILAKYHIYKQKLNNVKPTIDLFKADVKYYHNIEKYIYKKNYKEEDFIRRWQLLINIL